MLDTVIASAMLNLLIFLQAAARKTKNASAPAPALSRNRGGYVFPENAELTAYWQLNTHI